MRAMVIGDSELTTATVRELLVRFGCECSEDDVASFDTAIEDIDTARRELIALVVRSNNEAVLELLTELRGATDGLLLAIGPAKDPKFLLRAMRSGADEYIDEEDLETELEATLTRLRHKHNTRQPRGTVVTVLGASGGCGASTVAVNLAAGLARDQKRTLLVDLRLETADQTLLFDANPNHTLADLCKNHARMDSSMFLQALVPHRSGVHLLAAPVSTEGIRCSLSEGVRKALGHGRTQFPFTVLDMDRYSDPVPQRAIVQSDLLMLVFRLDITSLHGVYRTVAWLRESGFQDEQVHLVANQYGQPKELAARKVEHALGRKIQHYVPSDPARINSSINKGVPVVIDRPRSGVSRSMIKIADAVQAFHDRHARNGHSTNGELLPQRQAANSRDQGLSMSLS